MVDQIKLRCTRGSLNGEIFELDPNFKYVLGREPEPEDESTVAIILDSRTVSRNHAQISFSESSWTIQDLKSYNGLRVNRMRVREAYLSPGTIVEIGEFSFYVESEELDETNIENKQTDPQTKKSRVQEAPTEKKKKIDLRFLREKYSELDFSHKLIAFLFLLSLLSFLVLRVPVMIQIERDLLDQTYSYAIQTAVNLAEKNKRELADRSFYLLDCDYLRGSSVVQSASLWDKQANIVCPVGESREPDYLVELVQERQELVSDCDSSVSVDDLQACSVLVPVKVWLEDKTGLHTVGYARVDYYASDVIRDVQDLRALFTKAFFVILAFAGILWWLIRKTLKSATQEIVQDVHLLFTGTAQNVEHLQSFAVFNELVDEINRLFAKLNQEVSTSEEGPGAEASFLQNLIQQVFLLEERAVLAVDSENCVIAMTSFVPEVLPVQADGINLHISEAVADPHLQGELMGFLNDLSTSDEVLERPLSLADRVVQAHGMPLYFKDEHIATLVYF